MFDEKRYILINEQEVTPDILAQTEINSPRIAEFAGDPIRYMVLKWRGIKPQELWSEFPVYSDEEINEILELDLNGKPPQ